MALTRGQGRESKLQHDTDANRDCSLEFWAEAHAKWLAVAAGLGIAGAALSALTHARVSPRNHASVHRNKQRPGSQAA
jgi:hypothetical protein